MDRLRTIVLDDHPAFRKSLRNLMSRYEFIQVTGEAGSAEEALKAVEEKPPHLTIVDVHLKGMSGFDFARIVKQRFPGTQIVLISLYNHSSHLTEAASLGFPYVSKGSLIDELPPVLEDIRGKIDMVLRKRSKTKARKDS
jgi:DNA-binding NarL/FixJ family response regulator